MLINWEFLKINHFPSFWSSGGYAESFFCYIEADALFMFQNNFSRLNSINRKTSMILLTWAPIGKQPFPIWIFRTPASIINGQAFLCCIIPIWQIRVANFIIKCIWPKIYITQRFSLCTGFRILIVHFKWMFWKSS